MIWKSWLFRWITGFAVLGLFVPICLTLSIFLFGMHFGRLCPYFWPSSILLMGLDGPQTAPVSTVVFSYGLSWSINIFLYAIVGIWTSPILLLFRVLRNWHILDKNPNDSVL